MRKSYYINGWPVSLGEWKLAFSALNSQSISVLMIHFELEKSLSVQFLNDVLVADHSPAIVIKVVEPRGLKSQTHYLQCYGPSSTMVHLGRILYFDYDVVACMRIM